MSTRVKPDFEQIVFPNKITIFHSYRFLGVNIKTASLL